MAANDEDVKVARELARQVDALIAKEIERPLTVDELWVIGIVVGRLVGQKLNAEERTGEDALTGLGLFCDIVFCEAAHTLTEEKETACRVH